MSKPIHLYQLDINSPTEQNLFSLTQRHLKLAVEHGHRQTSKSRRSEIGKEIEAIRVERDFIIGGLRQQAKLYAASKPLTKQPLHQLLRWEIACIACKRSAVRSRFFYLVGSSLSANHARATFFIYQGKKVVKTMT